MVTIFVRKYVSMEVLYSRSNFLEEKSLVRKNKFSKWFLLLRRTIFYVKPFY